MPLERPIEKSPPAGGSLVLRKLRILHQTRANELRLGGEEILRDSASMG
jgi:hypothetical protein